ncbi:MAG: paraquat-inducible protein A [Pseudomonadota bacterium]
MRCRRCNAPLGTQRSDAFVRVFVLALTSLLLMLAAVAFPFLELRAAGLTVRTSIFDAVTTFSEGLLLPLSIAVAALIVLIPATRFLAVVYTLWPLIRAQPPLRHARGAFRLAETLRPWAMTEIFLVGISVALVKVAGLASISFGPAFWAFVALVIVTVFHDNSMSRQTIWRSLDPSRR